MSRSIEIVLRDTFVQWVGVYLRTFPRAYLKSGADPAAYGPSYAVYKSVVETYKDNVFRAAAEGINQYLNFFFIRMKRLIQLFILNFQLGYCNVLTIFGTPSTSIHFYGEFDDRWMIH